MVLQRTANTNALIGRSLNARWTAGVKISAGFSEVLNQKFTARVSPAIAHNDLPWSETTRRQLTALHYVGPNYYEYYSTTEFDQDRETRANHTLLLGLTQRQQLQTNFRDNVNVGVGYTFGSIYNKIVNQRFGNLGELGRRFGFFGG